MIASLSPLKQVSTSMKFSNCRLSKKSHILFHPRCTDVTLHFTRIKLNSMERQYGFSLFVYNDVFSNFIHCFGPLMIPFCVYLYSFSSWCEFIFTKKTWYDNQSRSLEHRSLVFFNVCSSGSRHGAKGHASPPPRPYKISHNKNAFQ